MQLARVEVHVATRMAGPVDGGPFDVIAVTGSLPTEEPVPMLRSSWPRAGGCSSSSARTR
jgi:protein-L-isoaspartate(D-aspartate) O-methyltransferase